VTTTTGALAWDPRGHAATSPLRSSGRASAAHARATAAQVRTLAGRGRLRSDARRASITQLRLEAATVRRAAADERGRSDARDRDDVADTRDDAANERDLLADDRDVIADFRDAAADVRDEVAEERDRTIDCAISPGIASPSARTEHLPVDSLTGREQEVLALMADGRSNHAIGGFLGVETKTVEAHIASIFSKLELLPALDDHRRVLAVLAHLGVPLV
jgi:ATP/maltotriose-dependent transcriptional regulator MalT